MNRTISTVGLGAVLAIGCASTVPASRVAATETAVQSARAAGAASTPGANTHLTMAERSLADAKKLNSDGDGDEAEAALSRAESDAALAAALADEARQQAPLGSVVIDRAGAKQAPAPSR